MSTWEPTGRGKVRSPMGAEWSLAGARNLLDKARGFGWSDRAAIQDLAAAIALEEEAAPSEQTP